MLQTDRYYEYTEPGSTQRVSEMGRAIAGFFFVVAFFGFENTKNASSLIVAEISKKRFWAHCGLKKSSRRTPKTHLFGSFGSDRQFFGLFRLVHTDVFFRFV